VRPSTILSEEVVLGELFFKRESNLESVRVKQGTLSRREMRMNGVDDSPDSDDGRIEKLLTELVFGEECGA